MYDSRVQLTTATYRNCPWGVRVRVNMKKGTPRNWEIPNFEKSKITEKIYTPPPDPLLKIKFDDTEPRLKACIQFFGVQVTVSMGWACITIKFEDQEKKKKGRGEKKNHRKVSYSCGGGNRGNPHQITQIIGSKSAQRMSKENLELDVWYRNL